MAVPFERHSRLRRQRIMTHQHLQMSVHFALWLEAKFLSKTINENVSHSLKSLWMRHCVVLLDTLHVFVKMLLQDFKSVRQELSQRVAIDVHQENDHRTCCLQKFSTIVNCPKFVPAHAFASVTVSSVIEMSFPVSINFPIFNQFQNWCMCAVNDLYTSKEN